MAPFNQNMRELRALSAGADNLSRKADESTTFEGRIDDEWLVLNVPNGGYLLGLIVEACNMVQNTTNLPDPLYLSTQFLSSSAVGACLIAVQRIKDGKSYANLTAQLIQNGRTNLHCQLIYGVISVAKHPYGPFPASPNYMTHAHPSSLSRRCPLSTHPSKCQATPFTRPYTFIKHFAQAVDPFYADQMDALSRNEAVEYVADIGGGGFNWAGWMEMVNEGDIITPQMIPFLTDQVPEQLPRSLIPKQEPMWFPTLALSLDFKYRVPLPSDSFTGIAPRTVGVFVTTKFHIEGRHETTSEIWTAPSGIGQGKEEAGWRDKMYCLAVATQTALTVPAAVNAAKGKAKHRL